MKDFVFLDANIFINYQEKKDKFTKLIKFLKDKNLVPAVSVYTVIELKTNINAKKSIEILTRNSDIEIILTTIKGLDTKLYTKRMIKKENMKKYKEQKRLYEGAYLVYLISLMAEFIKEVFDSEENFQIEAEKIDLSFKNFDNKKKANKAINEYLQKIKMYLLEFYNKDKIEEKIYKRKMKDKKDKILKKIIIFLKEENISNQTDELIELIANRCYQMIYKIMIGNEKEKIDKNSFFDLLFTTAIEERQSIMTKDKGIIRILKEFRYTEIDKYEEYNIFGLPNVMIKKIDSEYLIKMWENYIEFVRNKYIKQYSNAII